MKNIFAFILLFSLSATQFTLAQRPDRRIKISGSVVDINGKPVGGAVILIDEIKTEVVTSSRGMYKIRLLPSAKTVSVLTPDNQMKEVDINGKTVINFILDKTFNSTGEQVQKTENEVVDIGYGTVRKDRAANAVNKTNLDKTRSKSYANIYEMIKGEVPGVQVIGTSIRLQQGSGSLTSSTEPLFVVDGTVVNEISYIIPSQVHSVTLLKGPAASIYGSRGANGVIVITSIK